MKKIVLFLIFVTSIFAEGISGGFGYGAYQIGKMDFSSMNAELVANNYPTLDESFFSFGGGGFSKTGNLLIGGEGYGTYNNPNKLGTNEISSTLGYGFFNVGYLLVDVGNLKVYPLVGVGGYGMSIKLKNGEATASYSSSGLLFQGGIGLDYLLGGSGFLIGARAGYLSSPNKSKYGSLFNEEKSFSGTYASIVIGGGMY